MSQICLCCLAHKSLGMFCLYEGHHDEINVNTELNIITISLPPRKKSSSTVSTEIGLLTLVATERTAIP